MLKLIRSNTRNCDCSCYYMCSQSVSTCMCNRDSDSLLSVARRSSNIKAEDHPFSPIDSSMTHCLVHPYISISNNSSNFPTAMCIWECKIYQRCTERPKHLIQYSIERCIPATARCGYRTCVPPSGYLDDLVWEINREKFNVTEECPHCIIYGPSDPSDSSAGPKDSNMSNN
jgi:hypothetical protein